jgi:hypothetical protein
VSIFDRILGKNSLTTLNTSTGAGNVADDGLSHQMPSNLVESAFGEVNVRRTSAELQVQFTILMEPQGKEAEGWQTGVALDASASMKGGYGCMVEGFVPPNVEKEYEKRGWVDVREKDGRRVRSFQKPAYDDAIQKGYLKRTPNIVEPIAREFIAYLADNLDADGGTTVIYWACDDGAGYEVLGDFTAAQCGALDVKGPNTVSFGAGTKLLPAVKYFVERFRDAKRGMYIFITDGRLDDLDSVKQYTISLATEIASGRRNSVKCVLIGVGDEIDERQMEELDDLETGVEVDVWDHKIAREMRALVEIFAEVVDENQIIAPTGTIYDSDGKILKTYSDGVPAKITVSMPPTAQWFELEVTGQRIRQTVVLPNK